MNFLIISIIACMQILHAKQNQKLEHSETFLFILEWEPRAFWDILDALTFWAAASLRLVQKF
jgi:hypothetical protein